MNTVHPSKPGSSNLELIRDESRSIHKRGDSGRMRQEEEEAVRSRLSGREVGVNHCIWSYTDTHFNILFSPTCYLIRAFSLLTIQSSSFSLSPQQLQQQMQREETITVYVPSPGCSPIVSSLFTASSGTVVCVFA